MSENLGSKVNLSTMEFVERCLSCEGKIGKCPDYFRTSGYNICMWKIWTVFALGFFVMLVPFLGLPPTADLVIFLIFGLAIMILAFLSAREFFIK